MTFNGLHATTKYHAENIKQKGFDVSVTSSGKAGSGVYFWEYVEAKSNAQYLARQWWKASMSFDSYDRTQCCNYSEIDVSITVDKNNILDCYSNLQILEAFWETYPNGEDKEITYGAKFDCFIQMLEQELNISYSLIKIGLSVPKLRDIAFGNSFPALVLKKQINVVINCITIDDSMAV